MAGATGRQQVYQGGDRSGRATTDLFHQGGSVDAAAGPPGWQQVPGRLHRAATGRQVRRGGDRLGRSASTAGSQQILGAALVEMGCHQKLHVWVPVSDVVMTTQRGFAAQHALLAAQECRQPGECFRVAFLNFLSETGARHSGTRATSPKLGDRC